MPNVSQTKNLASLFLLLLFEMIPERCQMHRVSSHTRIDGRERMVK